MEMCAKITIDDTGCWTVSTDEECYSDIYSDYINDGFTELDCERPYGWEPYTKLVQFSLGDVGGDCVGVYYLIRDVD